MVYHLQDQTLHGKGCSAPPSPRALALVVLLRVAKQARRQASKTCMTVRLRTATRLAGGSGGEKQVENEGGGGGGEVYIMTSP